MGDHLVVDFTTQSKRTKLTKMTLPMFKDAKDLDGTTKYARNCKRRNGLYGRHLAAFATPNNSKLGV